MNKLKSIAKSGIVLAAFMFASACVVTPNEGYYDRDHHRYYHEHAWHECGERNDFCR